MECGSLNLSNSCHKSIFLTGVFLLAVFQLFSFHFGSHWFIPSITYLLSVYRVMSQGAFNALSADMTAVNSMRLLVVFSSPPLSSFSVVLWRNITPHPPGPGLPEHAPSVNISMRYI